jgi:hypothetical protein
MACDTARASGDVKPESVLWCLSGSLLAIRNRRVFHRLCKFVFLFSLLYSKGPAFDFGVKFRQNEKNK